MNFCRTFLFLLLALDSSAQQLSFFKPDNLKQLPSSETYNIMQDSRGYIWFSTEGGLCRFNGSTIKVFAAAEGLPEGATYTVFENKKGRIWLTTSQNRILYIDPLKDTIIEAPFSKSYADQCNKRLGHTYTARQVGDSILWLSTQHRTYHIDLRTNKISDRTIGDSIVLAFYGDSRGLLQYKRYITDSGFVHRTHTVYAVIYGKKKLCIPVPYHKPYTPDYRSFAVTNTQGDHFICFDNFLIQVKNDGTYKISKFLHPIICLYIDKGDGLWIGTYKGGAIYIPDTNTPDARIMNLSDLSVSGVCEDAEKGVWCTTLEKGVFYCRNKYVLNYTNVPGLEKRTEFLKVVDGRLYTSATDNELIEIRKDTLLKHNFTDGANTNRYYQVWGYTDYCRSWTPAQIRHKFQKTNNAPECQEQSYYGSKPHDDDA